MLFFYAIKLRYSQIEAIIIAPIPNIIPAIESSLFSDFKESIPNTIPVAPIIIPTIIRGITHSIKESEIATIPNIKEIRENIVLFII